MSEENETLSSAARLIILELARFLLQNNIGHKDFATMSRWAFTQAGTDILERKGQFAQKTLLELTGLSRSEIDRTDAFRDSDDDANKSIFESAMRVLHKWHTNPDLVNTDGTPRELDLTDPAIVAKLFTNRAHSTKETVINELEVAGSIRKISEKSWEAITRYYVPNNESLRFHYFGQVITRLISTLDKNMNGPRDMTWLERGVSSADLTIEARSIFARVGKERAIQFLEGLDDWTASNRRESEISDNSDSTVGFSIFYFED